MIRDTVYILRLVAIQSLIVHLPPFLLPPLQAQVMRKNGILTRLIHKKEIIKGIDTNNPFREITQEYIITHTLKRHIL